MELVYLWVEDYKNIHNQGFNFSPRFDCSYENEELKIIDKEETEEPYLKNFFGENINITAIVGENGSGKSNLLDLILDIDGWATTPKQVLYLMIKDNKLKLYLLNFNNEIICTQNLEQKIINRNTATKSNRTLTSVGLNLSYLSLSPFLHNINRFYSNSEINFLSIYNYKADIENTAFNFDDFFFSLIPDIPKLLENDFVNSFFNIKGKPNYLVFKINKYIQPLFKDEVKEILENSIKRIITEKAYIYQIKINNFKMIDLLHNLYKNVEQTKQDLYQKINELEEAKKKEYIPNISKSDMIDKANLANGLKENRQKKEKVKLNDQINEIGIIKFDFAHNQSSNYIFNFSTGELVLLYYIKKLQDINQNQKDLILCIDECELFLHPEWQKKFIQFLSELFIDTRYNRQIIISSHSPFILSDIPKENVIFLKDGEQVDVDINTFGANIHTLLSHGFFMKDGLMGEFAKNKINDIINFYEKIEENEKHENELEKVQKKFEYKKEYEDKKKYFKYIQSIIGEDYLKQVIKNHIVEIEKILYEDKYIDSEIEKTKQKLKRLEAIKDAKN